MKPWLISMKQTCGLYTGAVGSYSFTQYRLLRISLVLFTLNFRMKFKVHIGGNLSVPMLIGWKHNW